MRQSLLAYKSHPWAAVTAQAHARDEERNAPTSYPHLAAFATRLRALLVLHQNPLDDFQREVAYHCWQPTRGGNRKPGSPPRVRPKPAGLLVKLLLLGSHGGSNARFARIKTVRQLRVILRTQESIGHRRMDL